MSTAASSPLHFRPDRTFTIAQFTDLHWTDGDEPDQQTRTLMQDILDVEAPDLVALTGDVIDGGRAQDPAVSWREVVAPIVARELPWAAVFGNHDHEGTLDRTQLLDVQQTLPGCLTQAGPDTVSGVGNYILPILSADTVEPAATLYWLDSNDYAETTIGGYGWIRRDQINWYLEQAAQIQAQQDGEPLPALAFFHIPLPEYQDVWDFATCHGEKNEPICCPRINTGFFAALHQAGDVLGTFVGHDHINDFVGELHGIRLCFGRATGFNSYGKEGFPRGARLIRLYEGQHRFETWLRLEKNVKVSEQPRHEPELQRRLCMLEDFS